VEVPYAVASRDFVTGRKFRPRDGKTLVPALALSAVLLGPDTPRETK
jgi:hypothetical protein